MDRMIVFLLAVAASGAACRAAPSGFQTRTTALPDRISYSYQVHIPRDWSPDRTWPVILFLHGAGERGSDGTAHTKVGLPRFLDGDPEWPAVVVMPQCPHGSWWGDPDVERRVFAALEDAVAAFNGDRKRIYLTGLSLGGYGTWAFGYKYKGKFAALVPVCGGVAARSRIPPPVWHPAADPNGDIYKKTAVGIGSTPVWAFHGSADSIIPVSESRKLTSALKKAGGNVRYTEYPGVGHNSWGRAYSEPGLVDWLFRQSLP